ncbi:hypothetical protein U1Q18_050875 [Sarracenia purpurea var. burkii]
MVEGKDEGDKQHDVSDLLHQQDITGSGRGLGRGFAMKFAQLGCRVACADINDAINQQTVLEINEKYGPGKAIGYSCNIGMPKEIAELRNRILQDLGPVDVLVHNAGLIASTPSITDFEDLYLHGIITVNLSSHFLVSWFFIVQADSHPPHIFCNVFACTST